MTSRQQNQKRQQQQQQQKRKETLCERMAGFLKAFGLENKPEYAEKIPDTLTDQDFQVHDVSLVIYRNGGDRERESCNNHCCVEHTIVICMSSITLLHTCSPACM
jgi:hypothetical protein